MDDFVILFIILSLRFILSLRIYIIMNFIELKNMLVFELIIFGENMGLENLVCMCK